MTGWQKALFGVVIAAVVVVVLIGAGIGVLNWLFTHRFTDKSAHVDRSLWEKAADQHAYALLQSTLAALPGHPHVRTTVNDYDGGLPPIIRNDCWTYTQGDNGGGIRGPEWDEVDYKLAPVRPRLWASYGPQIVTHWRHLGGKPDHRGGPFFKPGSRNYSPVFAMPGGYKVHYNAISGYFEVDTPCWPLPHKDKHRHPPAVITGNRPWLSEPRA